MSAQFAGFSNVVVVVPSCSLLGVSECLTVTLLCYGRAPWSYLQLNEALLIYYINMLYGSSLLVQKSTGIVNTLKCQIL